MPPSTRRSSCWSQRYWARASARAVSGLAGSRARSRGTCASGDAAERVGCDDSRRRVRVSLARSFGGCGKGGVARGDAHRRLRASSIVRATRFPSRCTHRGADGGDSAGRGDTRTPAWPRRAGGRRSRGRARRIRHRRARARSVFRRTRRGVRDRRRGRRVRSGDRGAGARTVRACGGGGSGVGRAAARVRSRRRRGRVHGCCGRSDSVREGTQWRRGGGGIFRCAADGARPRDVSVQRADSDRIGGVVRCPRASRHEQRESSGRSVCDRDLRRRKRDARARYDSSALVAAGVPRRACRRARRAPRRLFACGALGSGSRGRTARLGLPADTGENGRVFRKRRRCPRPRVRAR